MATEQGPIGSGFTAASTTEDVIKGIDLTGKTAIVTGGYSGIGTETVRVLRAAGAHVIVPTRNHEKAAETLAGMEGIQVETMDLLDPASIDEFARTFLATGSPLHILVNSAGIMANPLTFDARGYESQFATNHLGHFQLVSRLWPALRRADGARVVSVSSWGHRYSDVHFDDPNFERRKYAPFSAYGQSRSANILFALGVDERGRRDGIRAFALHPGGIVNTGLGKHVPVDALRTGGIIDENGAPIIDPQHGLKTLLQGAATSVWCATSPRLEGLGGVYCEDVEVAPLAPDDQADSVTLADSLTKRGVMPYAVDPESVERLWKLSEALV
ncbi:SDR family NAD(P)-dependent oxidoreductase [Kibdelosporangium philippinense]|uniref:SDR family NAD(P)-dependent oxidoreductase n=1 Tax=Kibdelosporangium philippinense TaxID=211113 RepID=A0ABS8Z0W9_9PSEU|nr:SDR family NAD(P)-dependent oxidoreductase [Kibdelosporangium philippinense]MCE7001611.1 SDR family NAD(P)-dependent oxidoreductase [Kibdelosporangium philippinense]